VRTLIHPDRTTVRAIVNDVHTELFIDGTWREARSGRRFDVVNPATEEVLTSVADGDAADAEEAIRAAAATQKSWARTAPGERSDILRRAYDLVVARQEELAVLITAEMGKPIAEARGEVAYAAGFLRWFSEEAVRIGGETLIAPDGKTRIIVTKEPVGPCALVTPWNFPLAMGARKIGPAVAAGCTIVFKPADLTPLSSLALAQIFAEAGLPAGVLNVVCTTNPGDVVGTWLTSGLARKISFTGSTPVGVKLLEQAAQHVMRTSMELGGNTPVIVFDDANLDRAVDGVFDAKMRNMGESCTAANRIFIQRSIADRFASRLAERLEALTVGDGLEQGVKVGPLVEPKAVDKVQRLVDDAVAKGAVIKCGGSRPPRPGYFYAPTVLSEMPFEANLMSEEIFGPVAPIIPFDTEEEVVEMANNTPWGLSGYLFTQDVDRAHRVAGALEVGMVGLNTGLVSNPAAPFGGIKASGLGREGGRTGIEEFLEMKYMAMPIA
jgi:succinate-semialdehyde dehydrogenase / glutarate-semialdehyde dehydrogenase